MKITIDKNVPMPALGRTPVYPWHDMQPGDIFFVPGKTHSQPNPPTSLHRKGWKFSFRKVEENGVSGVRVWRRA